MRRYARHKRAFIGEYRVARMIFPPPTPWVGRFKKRSFRAALLEGIVEA